MTGECTSPIELKNVVSIYKALFDCARDMVFLIEFNGSILDANYAAVSEYGYTLDEMLSMNVRDLRAPGEHSLTEEHLNEAFNKGATYETIHRRKDGSTFPVEISSRGLMLDGKKIIFATIRDITDRRHAEQELRENRERFQLAQQVARVGTFDWNVQTGENTWSPEMEAIYGLPGGTFPGTYEAGEKLVYIEDRQMASRQVQEALKTGSFEGEWRVVWPDGTIHWIYARGATIKDKSGKPLKLIGVNIDITGRKQEEEALAKAKNQAEMYLDLMGHDINNMVQIAMGYLEISLERLSLTGEERKLLEKSADTLKNISTLIDNVRKLRKLEEGSLEFRKIDLCRVIENVIEVYSHIHGRSVTINFKHIPCCCIVANELVKDIFANLVGNAIVHSDPGKPLTVNISIALEKRDGQDYYRVAVEDNGPGIRDGLKRGLFKRFSNGKVKASGKGLGLHLVRTLVRDFHGKIWVEDRVQGDYTKGSRFVVLLPASD